MLEIKDLFESKFTPVRCSILETLNKTHVGKPRQVLGNKTTHLKWFIFSSGVSDNELAIGGIFSWV